MRYSSSVRRVVHWGSVPCIMLLAVVGQRGALAQAGSPEQPAGKEHITVVVSGIGVDEEGALRNAWSNAVRQAVGSLISSETLVQNDQVIKDEVLVYSDGLVVKTERLSGGKRDDGLFEVSIRALVETKKLQERLEGAKITVSNVDATSAVAEIVTTQEKRAAAAEMVSKAMEGFPESLLEVKVASIEPKVEDIGNGKVEATWPILVSFRRDLYYDVFVPKMTAVLDQICISKAELLSGESRMRPIDRRDSNFKPCYDLEFLPAFKNERDKFTDSIRGYQVLLIATSKLDASFSDGWSLYAIERDAGSSLRRALGKRLDIDVNFLDDGGVVLMNRELRLPCGFHRDRGNVTIYPCIYNGVCGYTIEVDVRIQVDTSILLRVKNITCSIESR